MQLLKFSSSLAAGKAPTTDGVLDTKYVGSLAHVQHLLDRAAAIQWNLPRLKAHRKLDVRYVFFTIQVLFFVSLATGAWLAADHTNLPQAPKAQKPVSAASLMVSNKPGTPQVNNGLKFGIFTNDPNPTSAQKLLGAKLDILGWFSHWNETLVNNKLQYACQNGYVPEITWESWTGQSGQNPYSLSDIAAGKYDSYIRQSLLQVRNVCKNQTVIIRFDHEMDTPVGVVGWYPWQGDPQSYIAAWQHVVSISRSIDPNIKWVWSPNRGTVTAELYYPGDQWADYVGLTLNRGTLPSELQYQSFSSFYGANQAVIESFGKPVIIAETTDDETQGDKAAWVTGMFNYAEADKNIVALVWFNDSHAYEYNSSPATLQAFQQSLHNLQQQGDK